MQGRFEEYEDAEGHHLPDGSIEVVARLYSPDYYANPQPIILVPLRKRSVTSAVRTHERKESLWTRVTRWLYWHVPYLSRFYETD